MTTDRVCPYCGVFVKLRNNGTCPLCEGAVLTTEEPEGISSDGVLEHARPEGPLGFLNSEKYVGVAARVANDEMRKEGYYSSVASEPRPASPLPERRTQAIKLVGVGVLCIGIVLIELLYGRVLIWLTVLLILGGPMCVYFGLVGLFMPRKYLGSALHDRLNKAGVVIFMVALICGCAYYIIRLLSG